MFKILGLLSSLSFMVFLSGCASSVVYKDVYIPTKCQIAKPTKPEKSGDTLVNLRGIITYSKEMENALDFCINGTID